MNLHLVEQADLRPIATWKAHVGFVGTMHRAGRWVRVSSCAARTRTRIAILTVNALGHGLLDGEH